MSAACRSVLIWREKMKLDEYLTEQEQDGRVPKTLSWIFCQTFFAVLPCFNKPVGLSFFFSQTGETSSSRYGTALPFFGSLGLFASLALSCAVEDQSCPISQVLVGFFNWPLGQDERSVLPLLPSHSP